jgi:hypothetical protein
MDNAQGMTKTKGYKKSKNLDTIEVKMLVKYVDEESNNLGDVEVSHIFKIPSPQDRELWNKMIIQSKGKKVVAGNKSTANWVLWKSCCVGVRGYDDLDCENENNWKSYFTTNMERIHVDNAVDILMDLLSSDEVEKEKKFEPSSEQ